jgi:hypothetical protein
MYWPVPDDWVLCAWTAFLIQPVHQTRNEFARRLLIADAFTERTTRSTSDRILHELKEKHMFAIQSVARECGELEFPDAFSERLLQVSAFMSDALVEHKRIRLPVLPPAPMCRWTIDGSLPPNDALDSVLAVQLWTILIRCPDLLSSKACDVRERSRLLEKAKASLQAPNKDDEKTQALQWERLREREPAKLAMVLNRVLWTVAVDTILFPASRLPTLSRDEGVRAVRHLLSSIIPLPTRSSIRQLGERTLVGSPAILLSKTATPMPWDHDHRPPLDALRQKPLICYSVASPSARLAGMQWLWKYAWTYAIRLDVLLPDSIDRI